jgi:hypothetical protein
MVTHTIHWEVESEIGTRSLQKVTYFLGFVLSWQVDENLRRPFITMAFAVTPNSGHAIIHLW